MNSKIMALISIAEQVEYHLPMLNFKTDDEVL